MITAQTGHNAHSRGEGPLMIMAASSSTGVIPSESIATANEIRTMLLLYSCGFQGGVGGVVAAVMGDIYQGEWSRGVVLVIILMRSSSLVQYSQKSPIPSARAWLDLPWKIDGVVAGGGALPVYEEKGKDPWGQRGNERYRELSEARSRIPSGR